jgi:hypothetical protein
MLEAGSPLPADLMNHQYETAHTWASVLELEVLVLKLLAIDGLAA